MWEFGIDEVGYGCWAGPVVVCGVGLEAHSEGSFCDSKLISASRREALFLQLINMWRKKEAYIFIAVGAVREINSQNILVVTHQCMERVYSQAPCHIRQNCYIDGRLVPRGLEGKAFALVKGDRERQTIGAASIFAKVWRDHYMDCLGLVYPEYMWPRNKGYGTAAHSSAIERFGITRYHRVKYKNFQKEGLFERKD